MPTGVQLVAPQGGEAILLGLAAHLQQLKPWQRHDPMTALATEQLPHMRPWASLATCSVKGP